MRRYIFNRSNVAIWFVSMLIMLGIDPQLTFNPGSVVVAFTAGSMSFLNAMRLLFLSTRAVHSETFGTTPSSEEPGPQGK